MLRGTAYSLTARESAPLELASLRLERISNEWILGESLLFLVRHQCVNGLLRDSGGECNVRSLISSSFAVLTGIKMVLTGFSLDHLLVLCHLESFQSSFVGLKLHTGRVT